MNVDDVFHNHGCQTYEADYVSPNAEKLLGITAEQIEGYLCPWETGSREFQRCGEKLSGEDQVHEQKEWDF